MYFVTHFKTAFWCWKKMFSRVYGCYNRPKLAYQTSVNQFVSVMMKTSQFVFWQPGSAHDATHSETCCSTMLIEKTDYQPGRYSEDMFTGCERSEESWDLSACDRLHWHILQANAWRQSCDICTWVKSDTPDLIFPAVEKRLKESVPCF